jgi:TonB family protein
VDVTDVLRDRMQQPGGLQRMLSVSITAHALLAAVVIFAPGGLLHHTTAAPTVMTISLGGGGGERAENGGMTPMGGRPIQEVKPADEPVKREPIRPPAAKAPEMTMPLPNAKPTKAAPAARPVKSAPEEARGRTPTRGDKVTAGSTVADTGIRGQGFGLSSSGGTGAGVRLDITGDFCCPAYLEAMKQQIERNWDRRAEAPALTVMKFTIMRDGTVRDVELEKRSGIYDLDSRAQRALALTPRLPPLPAQFTNATLTVHLTFEYTR